MKANKKVRKNRPGTNDAGTMAMEVDFMGSLDFVLKFILMVLLLTLLGLGSIFVHDFITQSVYFSIKTIHISGAERLTHSELISQAGVKPGDNILAVNLKTIRARLIAHPWIRDAALHRQIPSTLSIDVLEEKALARVSMAADSQLLLDGNGQPFKAYEPEKEPLTVDLPVITGLRLEPLDHGNLDKGSPEVRYGFKGKLHQAVMALLSLESIPSIQRITTDKDLGIAVTTGILKPHRAVDDDSVTLKLGFEGFKEKFANAERILDYMAVSTVEKKVSQIDLFNGRSVTVKLEDVKIMPGTTKGGV